VLEAEKDFAKAKHSDELDVPNLQVIKLMQSFTSQELVTERFAWRHYYWCVHSRYTLQQEWCTQVVASRLGPVLRHAACSCCCCTQFKHRFLTDKGIEYLREYLGLPADVVPATLKKSTK
jgi:small subunit ribosomal protein S10e